MAADRTIMSVEQVVPTAELTATAAPQSLLVSRMFVSGVVEAPKGAHFTSCEPDYGRDEAFQREYAEAARDPEAWAAFEKRYLQEDAR
jgi:glutaconate CoA-transferase subunit A